MFSSRETQSLETSCAEVSEDREVDDILRKLYPAWDEESERKVTDSAMAITIEGKPLILPSKEEEQKSELIGAKPKPKTFDGSKKEYYMEAHI